MVCTTEEEAKTLVDKVERYLKNEDAGPWKNRIVMMADDGDSNEHAEDAERVCNAIAQGGKNASPSIKSTGIITIACREQPV